LTREDWLLNAAQGLGEMHSLPLPLLRVSCGFPSRKATGRVKAIGECWPVSRCEDGIPQIFISPLLCEPCTPSGVLPTLLHELIHAVDDCKSGHRGNFAKLAKSCGLVGKMTATEAGIELIERLNVLSNALGPYPHAPVNPTGLKKQSTRMLKLVCGSCGAIVRASRKILEDPGAPLCACNSEPMQEG